MIEEDILQILKKSELFRSLTDDEMEQVYDFTMPRQCAYNRNQVILQQGESVQKIGIVKSGSVISTKYHFNGDTQILRIYKPGEVLSLDAVNSSFLTSPVTLISQSDSVILYIRYLDLLKVGTVNSHVKEAIMLNMNEILSNECVRLMYKIDVLSRRSLQERVLTYLSIIKEKKGTETIDISMNQEQFAQYLCVNRSVLSKELNKMRVNRIIDYHKSNYTILNK